jgi:hypothetical protein
MIAIQKIGDRGQLWTWNLGGRVEVKEIDGTCYRIGDRLGTRNET